MANAEPAERARMFEERAEKATDPISRQHYRRNGRPLSIAVSRTPGRSIRMRVGGPSGSLFKRQVVLDLAPSLTIRRLVELGLKAKSK